MTPCRRLLGKDQLRESEACTAMNQFISVGIAILFAGCASEQVVVGGKPVMTVTAEMQKEARYACYGECGDTASLRQVIEQGFPVNHVVNEYGDTLLHIVAEVGNRPLVRFLLANGADVMAVDRHGNRPIDVAYAEKHWGVCRLLALKSPPFDATLEDIPSGVWEVAFREMFLIRNSGGPRFLVLSVGGRPVSDAVAKWVSEQGLNVGTNGYYEDIDHETGLKVWRDSVTKEIVILCWFFFEKLSNDHYRVTINSRSSPSECQWFGECDVRKKYGYWLVEWVGSGHGFASGTSE